MESRSLERVISKITFVFSQPFDFGFDASGRSIRFFEERKKKLVTNEENVRVKSKKNKTKTHKQKPPKKTSANDRAK